MCKVHAWKEVILFVNMFCNDSSWKPTPCKLLSPETSGRTEAKRRRRRETGGKLRLRYGLLDGFTLLRIVELLSWVKCCNFLRCSRTLQPAWGVGRYHQGPGSCSDLSTPSLKFIGFKIYSLNLTEFDCYRSSFASCVGRRWLSSVPRVSSRLLVGIRDSRNVVEEAAGWFGCDSVLLSLYFYDDPLEYRSVRHLWTPDTVMLVWWNLIWYVQ